MATTVTPESAWTFSSTAAMQDSHIIPSTAYIAVLIVTPLDAHQLTQCPRPGTVTFNTESVYPTVGSRSCRLDVETMKISSRSGLAAPVGRATSGWSGRSSEGVHRSALPRFQDNLDNTRRAPGSFQKPSSQGRWSAGTCRERRALKRCSAGRFRPTSHQGTTPGDQRLPSAATQVVFASHPLLRWALV